MTNEERQEARLDTSVPRTARIWNYLLGGTDNFAVDREIDPYGAVGCKP